MTATSPYHSYTPPVAQTPGGQSSLSSDPELSEKMGIIQAAIEREENTDAHFDVEKEGAAPPERPFLFLHAAVVGVAMTLVVFVEMLCIAKVTVEKPEF